MTPPPAAARPAAARPAAVRPAAVPPDGASSAEALGFGFVEWFRPGEHERVEQVVDGLLEAGAGRLRTHLSWAEYHRPGGQEWYDWLLPTLGRRLELLPCVHYTPPSLSRTGLSSGPPHRLRDYADFIDLALTRYGHCFSHVELWNEPNNLLDWDWRVDHDWQLFSEMIGDAAHWAQQRGWQVVLGGPARSIATGSTSWASGACSPMWRPSAVTAFPAPGTAKPPPGAAGTT
jgi:hypothetical protein